MKKQVVIILSFVLILAAVSFVFAADNGQQKKKSDPVEANVWTTADGAKHFVCPVTKNEGVIDENTKFAIVDGKKYYFCCAGCQPKFEAEPQKYLDGFVVPANVIKVDAKKGKVFQCPVSGEKDAVTEKTAFSDVDGKRYYFCCNDCKKKFDKEPKKFIKEKTSK